MSLSYYTQDPKELFDLLLDLREFSDLWLQVRIKTRIGEEAKAEKQRLGELIEKLADKLEILPFRGRLLKHLLTKRPTILPKWTGIPETVDKILFLVIEYLTYRCDHAVWQDISQNPTNINEYLEGKEQPANGLMFEIIIRRWLREIKKEHWLNTQSFRTPIKASNKHSIEIDALSLIKQQTHYHVAAAEIKWTLTIKQSGEAIQIDKKGWEISISKKFSESLKSLEEHFERWLKIKTSYTEIALVSGIQISPEYKQKAKNFLYQELSKRNVKTEIIQVYDVEDIWNTVKDTTHPIKNVIEQVSSLR